MTPPFFAELAVLLDGLAGLGGCGLRWKDADLELRAATPARLRAHEIGCCREAQRRAVGRAACRRDCLVDPAWWRRRDHRGHHRRCHRGVLEHLEPVRHQDALLGTLHVGPFRDGRSPGLPGVAALPTWRAADAQRLAVLAVQGLRLLAPLREQALLGLAVADEPEVASILHRIRARARVDLRLDALAAELRWPSDRLARRLRRATGRSFTALRAEAVTARAQARLATGNEPLAAIADALGYRHHTHFSQAFRRATGRSPSDWRREHQAQRV